MRSPTLACLALLAPLAAAAQVPPALAPAPAPAEGPALPVVGFDEAVARATRHATAAGVAAAQVRRAQGLLEQARAGSLPLVSANATLTRLDDDRTQGGVVVLSKDQSNANLAASVPLFVPGRWYQWSHASDVVDVARASQEDVRRQVTVTAAHAYLTVISQRRAVEVSQRAVEVGRAHLEYATRRREAGAGNALDEARADQQLAAAEAQLEAALAGLARGREALGVALGAEGPVDAGAEPDLAWRPADPAEAEREAEARRADVEAARQRAAAAERVARDSWADWLPTILATGQAWRQDPGSTTTPEQGWQANLVAVFPLFEGGQRVGQLHERDALALEAREQLAGLSLQARSEVRTARSTLAHAEAAQAQARRGAERARQALTMVAGAFKEGATTSLDVVDAQQRARDADVVAVVAEDAVRQARLDLLAATGRFPGPAR